MRGEDDGVCIFYHFSVSLISSWGLFFLGYTIACVGVIYSVFPCRASEHTKKWDNKSRLNCEGAQIDRMRV